LPNFHDTSLAAILDFKIAAILDLFCLISRLFIKISTEKWCLHPHFGGQGRHWSKQNVDILAAILDFKMAAILNALFLISRLLIKISTQEWCLHGTPTFLGSRKTLVKVKFWYFGRHLGFQQLQFGF